MLPTKALYALFSSHIFPSTLDPTTNYFFNGKAKNYWVITFVSAFKGFDEIFLPHANFAKTIIVYIITGTSDYSTLTINHNQKNFNQAQTATNSIPRCFEFNVEIINRNQNNQFWFSVFWFALLLKNHSKTYFRAYT